MYHPQLPFPSFHVAHPDFLQNPKAQPPNGAFTFSPTTYNPAYNPKYYREQPRGMHHPSSSTGSVDMKTGSHLFIPPNADTTTTSTTATTTIAATNTLPPLHRILSAHDRDRSDQSPYSANSMSGSSGSALPQVSPQASYNGMHGNNADPRNPMYSLAPPNVSPSSVPHTSSSYISTKPVMTPGYNQLAPSSNAAAAAAPPGYAQSPEAGQSSGTSSP